MTSVAPAASAALPRITAASTTRAAATPTEPARRRGARAGCLIPVLKSSRSYRGRSYDGATYSDRFMSSFRKRLLVLIIGLVVVTQTVTLAAVLLGTRNAVEQRAAEQLSKGGEL